MHRLHPAATRINLAAAVLLLTLAVLTGGSSQEAGLGVLVLQLLALPCIAWVAWQRLQGTTPPWPWQWTALAASILAVPLLQLIPLPASLAGVGESRALLQADLAAAGAPSAAHASLDPQATRAALHLLLPALAVFGLVAALPAQVHRRLAWCIAALAMASLLLGILQLGAPQESPLNPYPQWAPAMNGFFANPNHQATLLVVAGVLAAGWLFHAPARAREPGQGRGRGIMGRVAAAAVVALAVAALPLTGSRAGVIIFILALAAAVASQHWRVRHARGRRLLVAGSAGVAALGVLAAMRWMQVEAVRELRGPMREATLDVAAAHAPLGSGMGSFVPVFEQATSHELLMPNYVNHAHNEYAQWLLEAGALALPAMVLGGLALVMAARALWRLPPSARSAGLCALIALLAILVHSWVDYPLRTPALLVVTAALAGLLAGAQSGTAVTKTGDNGHLDPRSADALPPAARTGNLPT